MFGTFSVVGILARRERGGVGLGHPETDKLPRLTLRLFMLIQAASGGETLEFGETINVGREGIYMHTRARFLPEQEVNCLLLLPPEITRFSTPMFVGCHGKVLAVKECECCQKLGVELEVYGYDHACPA